MNYITVKQAAEMLHVSTQSIRNYTGKDMFRSIRTPGGHRKIAEEDILKFVSEMEQERKLARHLHTTISLKDAIPEETPENKEESFE